MNGDPSPETPQHRDDPTFSVVMPTFNRCQVLPRAIQTVLAQTFSDLELIVVDDGSTDDTRAVVASIPDPRLRYVRQENQGLSGARNAGAACAAGEWITFLDDDDQALPQWLENFRRGMATPDAGMVSCAFIAENEQGDSIRTVRPRELGPVYDNQVGQFLAGTFTVRRRVFEDVGGYAPGLTSTHGTELGLRLVPHCLSLGHTVRSVSEPGVRIEQRPPERRPMQDAEQLYDGARYVLSHHRDRIIRSPRVLANYFSIAGVNASKLGRKREAIGLLAGAVRAEPTAPRRWGRLILAVVPPLANRVWRRTEAQKNQNEIP